MWSAARLGDNACKNICNLVAAYIHEPYLYNVNNYENNVYQFVNFLSNEMNVQ